MFCVFLHFIAITSLAGAVYSAGKTPEATPLKPATCIYPTRLICIKNSLDYKNSCFGLEI